MEEIQKATLAQQALQQFEDLHKPVDMGDNANVGIEGAKIICVSCSEDWPCERMSIVLISQSISMLTKMIPSGNLSSVLSRFSQSQQ